VGRPLDLLIGSRLLTVGQVANLPGQIGDLPHAFAYPRLHSRWVYAEDGRHVKISPMMTRYPHVYVLNVMSDDHPGIVAAVSDAVESLGGNIDACSQTVLGGYFTLIMIVSVPERIDPEQLAQQVRGAESSGSPYQVLVRPALLPSASLDAEPSDRFVISAFGRDQPGIVRRFSQYLAGRDVNIVDLYGDRRGDEFVLIGQVQVPARWDIRLMQADLEQMGQELGFTVKLQHENIFVATNQLRLGGTKGLGIGN
jgi:glycine cleavage system transcriptional repressor